MKILQIPRQFYPGIGGIEFVVLNLSKELIRQGHESDVLTLNRLWEKPTVLPKMEVLENIKIERVPYWGSNRYAIAPGVLKHIHNYDILHVHSSDFLLDYLSLTRPWHRKPIVLSTHGVFFHTNFGRFLKSIYFYTITRFAIKQVEHIICDSQQDYLLLRKISREKKLHLIPNGIAFKKLTSLPKKMDQNLIISVGRLANNKRYDRLLEAFSLVVKQKPDTKLVIIGPDFGEFANLEILVNKLDLQNNLTFTGEISENELHDYLSRANIWLNSSEYESFGIALLEAMASGCFPIVQPLHAYRQLIENHREGYYADFDDAEKTAKTIEYCLDLPPFERQEIVSRAQQKAASLSWENVAGQFEKIYLECFTS